MFQELIRDFGPFSRIGSVVNVFIAGGILAFNVLNSESAFERTGWLVWGVIVLAVFVTLAIVVWVRSFRVRPGRSPRSRSYRS